MGFSSMYIDIQVSNCPMKAIYREEYLIRPLFFVGHLAGQLLDSWKLGHLLLHLLWTKNTRLDTWVGHFQSNAVHHLSCHLQGR